MSLPCKCLLGSVLISQRHSMSDFLLTLLGQKQSSFLRTLMPAELDELRRRRGNVLSVGALGLRWGLCRRCRGLAVLSTVVVSAGAGGVLRGRRPGFVGLLLSTSLLLPQQLLGLQEDTSVKTGRSTVAVTRALVSRVDGVLLGRLESLSWGVHPVPRVLGHRAVVLTRLPRDRETRRKVNCTLQRATLNRAGNQNRAAMSIFVLP